MPIENQYLNTNKSNTRKKYRTKTAKEMWMNIERKCHNRKSIWKWNKIHKSDSFYISLLCLPTRNCVLP